MFDETDLHSLIALESERRAIPLRKLLRESLLAAANGQFKLRNLGSPIAAEQRRRPNSVTRHLRVTLRRLAIQVGLPNDWGWWHKPPWSELKSILVNEIDYLTWLNEATKQKEAGATETTPKSRLQMASDRKIDDAISVEYDKAGQQCLKPPNVKEIVGLVRDRLEAEGYHASGRQIQTLAEAKKHKDRRRPPGRTVTSEKSSR
jgi:hypothetical protein